MKIWIDITVRFDEFETCDAVQNGYLKEKQETEKFVFTQSKIKNYGIYVNYCIIYSHSCYLLFYFL
jgi:hypothetical protein